MGVFFQGTSRQLFEDMITSREEYPISKVEDHPNRQR
jgi:hypothetical protein